MTDKLLVYEIWMNCSTALDVMCYYSMCLLTTTYDSCDGVFNVKIFTFLK